MGEEVMTQITEKLTAVSGDIVTVGGIIVVLAATVLGIRWLKAQFF